MIEKLLTGFALSATAHQLLSGAREGCTKQCGDEGREMVQLSSVVHPQTQTHTCIELLLSPLLCPAVCGQVPQNPYRANTKLIFMSCFERCLRRKRPLLVCQAVCSPQCTQSLFTVIPQSVNQRE